MKEYKESDVMDEFKLTWDALGTGDGDKMLRLYEVYHESIKTCDAGDRTWAYREARERHIEPDAIQYGINGNRFFPRLADIIKLIKLKVKIDEGFGEALGLIEMFKENVFKCSIGISNPFLSNAINDMGGFKVFKKKGVYQYFAKTYGRHLLNYELTNITPESMRVKGTDERSGKDWKSISLFDNGKYTVIDREAEPVMLEATKKRLQLEDKETGVKFDLSKVDKIGVHIPRGEG